MKNENTTTITKEGTDVILNKLKTIQTVYPNVRSFSSAKRNLTTRSYQEPSHLKNMVVDLNKLEKFCSFKTTFFIDDNFCVKASTHNTNRLVFGLLDDENDLILITQLRIKVNSPSSLIPKSIKLFIELKDNNIMEIEKDFVKLGGGAYYDVDFDDMVFPGDQFRLNFKIIYNTSEVVYEKVKVETSYLFLRKTNY